MQTWRITYANIKEAIRNLQKVTRAGVIF